MMMRKKNSYKKAKRRWYVALKTSLAMSLTMLVACQHSPDYPLQVVHESTQCAVIKPTIKLIRSANELQQYMISNVVRPNKPKQLVATEDMAQQTFVLVAAGQQSSAGYRYEVASDMATFNRANNTVMLPIKYLQPKKGNLQAQVLTAPCVIVAVENLPDSVNASSFQLSK